MVAASLMPSPDNRLVKFSMETIYLPKFINLEWFVVLNKLLLLTFNGDHKVNVECVWVLVAKVW